MKRQYTGSHQRPPVAARAGAVAALEAFLLPLEGLRLLMRERSLWGVAAVPLALSVLACVGAVAAVLGQTDALYGLATGWMPVLVADRWFEWLWVAPARALLALLGWLAVGLLAALALVLAFALASLAAAPFHELLSRRVEALVTGTVAEAEAGSLAGALRDAGRSVLEELRRLVFFLSAQGGLVLAGILVPGAALLVPPAVLLLTMLFLPLDYASPLLDRRRLLRFRDKRRWVLGHVPAMVGFGAAALLVCLVPGLNLLAMPVLVVGGTLLALRHPPASPS